jgi:hypothetical protein
MTSPSNPDWPASLGRHTQLHIGLSEDELRARLQTDGLKRASSFDDEETARWAARQLLEAAADDIQAWLAAQEPGKLRLDRDLGMRTGMAVHVRGGVMTAHGATVILELDPDEPVGYSIVTAFPS